MPVSWWPAGDPSCWGVLGLRSQPNHNAVRDNRCMIRTIAMSSVLLLALPGAAFAQSDPAIATAPAGTAAPSRAQAWAGRAAVMALRGAYRAIADAEAMGASSYLDAAKTHYRGALARYARHDAGAAAEAMAATALAHAAAVEHPMPAPRDIPAPPEMTAMSHPAGDDVAIAGGMPGARPMMGHGSPMRGHGRGHGGFGMGGRFDATQLAKDASLANTAEAKDLAQKAVDADLARTRAAFSGNLTESMRQGRLANDLAMAVRSLARADHPPARPQRSPGARGGWTHQSSGDGIVGGAGSS